MFITVNEIKISHHLQMIKKTYQPPSSLIRLTITHQCKRLNVDWVKRNLPSDVQFHVSLWKPNDIQDSICRA